MLLNKLGGRMWSLLVSRSLSVWLLVAVTLILAVGAFLPNPAFMTKQQVEEMMNEYPFIYWLGERYNSQKLASGYLFGFIGIFLVVSTTMCSIDRLLKRRKSKVASGMYPGDSVMAKAVEIRFDSDYSKDRVLEKLKLWFRKRKMRVYESEGMIVGFRGEAGFWGSVLFHAILIVALIGVAIYYLGGVRASFNITEGQILRLDKSSFFYIEKKPLWRLKVPDVVLMLLSVTTIYDINNPKTAIDHAVGLRLKDMKDGKERTEILKINKPLKIDGMDFLLIRGGFSPWIVITENGKKVFDNFVALRSKDGKEDYFMFRDMIVNVEVYPDFYIKDGMPASKTPIVKNPHFRVEIKKGNKIKEEIIPLNGVFDEGSYQISIPDMKKWVEIQMVKEPGIGLFFIMSFLGIIGLIIRFLDPEERIYIMFLTDGRLQVGTYSKYFPGLINERMAELIRFLNSHFKGEIGAQEA